SWSFGIERELPSHILINAEYIGKKGTHLPFTGSTERNHLGPWVESLRAGPDCSTLTVACLNTSLDNPPVCAPPLCNPFFGIITDPNSEFSGSIPYYQLLRPFPQFGVFSNGVSSEPQLIANSVYHGLQFTAEKKYSNGLQLLATFAWS